MRGANPRAEDRFDTDEQHAKSNIVCNQFVEWGWKSYKERPDVDIIVFMVYTVLRQGDFTGRHVLPGHIFNFLQSVKLDAFEGIPFPGITRGAPIDPRGHNWRFCGSTHIWPVKYLKDIRRSYKEHARPQEVKVALCQSNKARELLDYSTKTPLLTGLLYMRDAIVKRGPRPFKYHLDLEIVTEKTPKTWLHRLF